MATRFLNNGNKAHIYINTIWRRHSISDSIGAPITKTHFQQPKASYSRFPQRKVKDIEFSVPFPATNTEALSRLSSIPKTGLIGWYLGVLKNRPILTKSITSAFIYTAADLSSQVLEFDLRFLKF